VKLNVSVNAVLDLPNSVATVFQVEPPAIIGAQTVDFNEVYITPFCELEPFTDLYGNLCRRGMLPAGQVVMTYNAKIDVNESRGTMVQAHAPDPLTVPPDILHYLLPSRYCESDRLGQMAQSEFGRTKPGFARVQTICDWINEHILYSYGMSNVSTTACDTAVERIGVCRDYAHLAIAFCRAMGIPARYVSGYCLELSPPDFHAFFQAWLDGRWVTFDATEMQPRPALVMVATGRDAADCAWCTFFGEGSTTSLDVTVDAVT
jgi:transglutaminase-like putative cysteine protease